MHAVDALLLLPAIPFVVFAALALRPRPTVAEVHSWLEDGVYRMLLVLNGQDHFIRAGWRLRNGEDATIRSTVLEMTHALARGVRFTTRTVFIPEGAYGLDADPRRVAGAFART